MSVRSTDLSKASSIASSKVRLCRDRILLASAVSSILARWPNNTSLFLYDNREGKLFRHTPHFAVENAVEPAYIKDPPRAPLIQCINFSGPALRSVQHYWQLKIFMTCIMYICGDASMVDLVYRKFAPH